MFEPKARWAAAAAAVAGMVVATVVAAAPPAAAAKSAFVIGFVNTTQGPIQFPGLTDGAQAAVQYVNAHGGINGHPLVLAVCDLDATPEKNLACGQQFANDPRLKMVNTGFTLSPGAMYSALTPTGLPVIQSYPASDAEYLAPNAVAYNGGAPGATVGTAELANAMNAQTVGRYVNDVVGSIGFTNFFMARFKGPKAGVKNVAVPVAFTDALPYLLQGGAATADFNMVAVSNCLPFARAMAQLGVPGTKVGAASSCIAPNQVGPNAGLFEGWRAAFFFQDAGFGPITPDLKTLINEYPKYAKLPTTPTFPALVSQGWGTILTLQNVLRGVPDSVLNNKAALLKVLKAYRGPGTLTAPTMKCGSVKGLPSLCTTYTMKGQNRGGRFYRIAG